MSTALIFVLLGSALLHAVWNAIIKGGTNKLFETVMKAGGAGFFAFVTLLFLPLPPPACWPYILGSVGIHLFYYLLLAYAYRGADMSYAYTIMRGSSPLFTALAAVFILGDQLTAGGWTGVLLLSAGILVLALDSIRHGAFRLEPTLMALGNAFVIMGYTVVDGAGVRLGDNAVSYVCCVFFLNSFPILLFALVKHKGEYFRYAGKRWKYGLFGGFCSYVAYGISVWAMTRAPISLVAALRETSVIFGMLLAVFMLKECFYPARALSVLLVMGGAMAIKFFA